MERSAVRSNVFAGIVALTAAVAPNSISCLISRHAPLRPRDIDGELDRLRSGPDTYVSLYGCAASVLRGGDPVITISKQKGVVLKFKDRHRRQLVEHLGITAHAILIKVPTRIGWRVLEQPLDVNLHLPSLLPPARIECRKRTDLKWEPQSQTASLGQQPAVQTASLGQQPAVQTASLGQQPAVQTASLGQQPGGSFVIWTSQ